jgi:hypothetical protein
VSGAINNVFSYLGSGHAEGQLTFTDNQNNSVTITVHGPMQTGFSSAPQQFAYRVTAATGSYANLSAQGTLTLTLQSQTASMTSITVPFAASPTSTTRPGIAFAGAEPAVFLGDFGEQGTFTLSISADNTGFDALWGSDTPTGFPFHLEPIDIIDPIVPIGIDPVFVIDHTEPVDSFGLAAVGAPIRLESTIPFPASVAVSSRFEFARL